MNPRGLVPAFIFSFCLIAGCKHGNSGAPVQASKADKPKEVKEIVLPISQQGDGLLQFEAIHLDNQPEYMTLPGKIVLADDRSWHVGVVSAGRVEQVYVKAGDAVRKGQVLARMHSHDVHDTRAAYLSAQSELSRAQAASAMAHKNLERTQRLYDLKAASLEELERARQESTNADTTVRGAQIAIERERVHLQETLGVPAEVKPGQEQESELIPIRSPGDGYVMERDISPGAMADPAKDVFVLGDIRLLWMLASANESSIAQLKLGQEVIVTTRAFPNEQFRGKITNLGQQLDPTTRVMPVRVELQNVSLKLRPEMLATAQVAVGRSKPALMVPSEAIQQMNDQDVVFVKKDAEHFEPRFVHTAETVRGRTRILEGLAPNEVIAAKGSFILKSLMLKSEIQGEE
jgi:cobalt-zinc-cadmium efflux system membrane fusion protein